MMDGELPDASSAASLPQDKYFPGASNFDVDVSHEAPWRGKHKPPQNFGHPRGFSEDPIRDNCPSNFGKGGVRHYRRRMAGPISTSLETNLSYSAGGLCPGKGPIFYGHRNTAGTKSPGKPNQRRIPNLIQRQKDNFVGMSLLPPDPLPKPPPCAPPPYARDSDKEPNPIQRRVNPTNASHLFRDETSGSDGIEHQPVRGHRAGKFSPAHEPGKRELPSWGWNPKKGKSDTSIPDVLGTHDFHNAGKGRKARANNNLPEGEYAGAKTKTIAGKTPCRKMVKPEWDPSRHNTFETVGATPQHLGLFVQSSKKPSFEPPAHPAGALHDPKFQVNRKKNCMLSTHNTFNTVGITPQMMGVPVDLQAGGPQPPKPPVSNSEFLAGAPTSSLNLRRVGKKEGEYSQRARQLNSFDSVGASMVLVDDNGRPLGEPIRRKESLRPSLY